ncbi:MAG: hypothetical protein H7836_08155 [Magnetococcus sp. YQC-3]
MEIYNEIEKLVDIILPCKNTGMLPFREDPIFKINDRWYLIFCRYQNSTNPLLTTDPELTFSVRSVRYSVVGGLCLLNDENILKVKTILEEYIIGNL